MSDCTHTHTEGTLTGVELGTTKSHMEAQEEETETGVEEIVGGKRGLRGIGGFRMREKGDNREGGRDSYLVCDVVC